MNKIFSFFAIIRSVFRLSAEQCLLADGMHSCVYVPKGMYRRLMKSLRESLEKDAAAENSLRFLWTKRGEDMLLVVNPRKDKVDMACTHGLTKDSKGRVLIPCPYMQQIFHRLDLPPEWCGRLKVEFEMPALGGIEMMRMAR